MAENLRELIEEGTVFPAMLPEANDLLLNPQGKLKAAEVVRNPRLADELHGLPIQVKLGLLDLSLLETLAGYTVPLIAHDYGAKTPVMWNTLYQQQGINIRNIMVVANPEKTREILEALKRDPKYLGGGAGVGFKESVIPYLDSTDPGDLSSVNIIVKENNQLVGRNTDAEGLMRSLEEKMAEAGTQIKDSVIIILGAGGVAKQFARIVASKAPRKIRIINRSYEKATEIANQLNNIYGRIAVGLDEDLLRGSVLNSFSIPDAIINTTEKGSDGQLERYAAFSAANLPPIPQNIGTNLTESRTNLRELKNLNPNIVIADIVLPKSGRSVSLRLADNAGLKYTLDGKPMVIYQGAPAYKMIEEAHPAIHTTTDEQIILETFKKAAA